MTASEEIDFREIDDGDNGNADQFVGLSYGITALNVDSLFDSSPYTEQNHFRWRDDSTDLNSSGGFLAAEDSNAIGDVEKNDTIRLRISVANSGPSAESAARQYELQWVDVTSTTCQAATGWVGIADAADDFDMVATTNITPDGEATTSSILANSEGYTRINGEGRESADTTGSIGPLSSNNYTELEYSFTATASATSAHTYCFRLYDQAAGSVLDGYPVFPELTIASEIISIPSGLGEAGTFTSEPNGGWSHCKLYWFLHYASCCWHK